MIHPLTYIDPDAKLAPNVKVDPFTVIHKNVEIGENTWIGSNVTIMEGARIGKNCKIFPGAVLSAIPQDLKFEGEESEVIIKDNTTIREFVTIHRGTKDKRKSVIGENCLIMAYCHIAHDCIVGNNCILSNNATLPGHINVGNYALLGGMCAVHQFCNIGRHAFVTGGTLVRKDIPPYAKAAREPISYVGVNSIGLKRRGYSIEQINHIMDIYRILYVRGNSVCHSLKIIETEIPATEERDEILSFIRNSTRGIMRGYSRRSNNDIIS